MALSFYPRQPHAVSTTCIADRFRVYVQRNHISCLGVAPADSEISLPPLCTIIANCVQLWNS